MLGWDIDTTILIIFSPVAKMLTLRDYVFRLAAESQVGVRLGSADVGWKVVEHV